MTPSETGRAWVEIDLDAVAHNARGLGALLPEGCKLMAVVKADGYGHGARHIAGRLHREGVDAFAVATAAEGADLREVIQDGEILVLGYTHPGDAATLSGFKLSQTVVDMAHAKALDAAGHKLGVHIMVDTGMHRLGIDHSDLAALEGVFACKNLTVKGVATHFATSDGTDDSDVEFTILQAERFFGVVRALRGKGYDVGKLHAQASYGLLNYPDMKCDYARAGIALYGVLSDNTPVVTMPALRPVLSLKARVARVQRIGAGESVSYGRTFTAFEPVTVATICVGYGDGVPRQLSGNGGEAIVRGRRVPLVGRVCMDMVIADVSSVPGVEPGDVATLIGRDGAEELRCEDLAERSGTITNDILGGLGKRMPRIYL
jgi:serine/alanine racemase